MISDSPIQPMVTSTPVRRDSSLEEISVYKEFGFVIVWPANRRHIGNMSSFSSEPEEPEEPEDVQGGGDDESSIYLPTP